MRASLIRGETLAEIARELQLGDYLRLGSGEMKSGGKRRESILADALEALIGAIYLDGGIEQLPRARAGLVRCAACSKWFPAKPTRIPKTRLQEWLQARAQGIAGLRAGRNARRGAQSIVRGRSAVFLPSASSFSGSGDSRRAAEQVAAQGALLFLLRKIIWSGSLE